MVVPDAVKPALLVVDDEPGVARAVERDLRERYGDRLRVVRAESGPEAMALLDELHRRGDPVAGIVADQRMPEVTGLDVLARAAEIAPQAKRVLLTAYADTDAAIRAINDVRLDHYLLKPWDPPEEKLYPTLDDLLDDWWATFRPPFQGVRVVGHRWSPASHAVRDFLARNGVPYEWLDIERNAEAQRALSIAAVSRSRLPVVMFERGGLLVEPSLPEIAERLGLAVRAEHPFYDLAIVGGGPAGLAAAVYGASEGLRTVLVEREAPGGQAGQSSRIENYLGFPVGLSGGDLTRRAVAQARRFGAELLTTADVVSIEAPGPARRLGLSDGTTLEAHTLLLATGVQYQRLDVPGAEALAGRGLYYGAGRSEASTCSGERVFVVGGANSAGQAAVYFSQFADEVTILYRGESLTKGMSRYLVDQIETIPSISVRLDTDLIGLDGNGSVETISVRDRGGQEEQLPASAVFVFIGALPNTAWLDGVVARDDRGFVLAGPAVLAPGVKPAWPLERDPFLLETSLPGVFVAGDVRSRSIKRVASGVGEGSMAVQFIHQYLGAL
jgi:thioredoxin reductase (NADPH)